MTRKLHDNQSLEDADRRACLGGLIGVAVAAGTETVFADVSDPEEQRLIRTLKDRLAGQAGGVNQPGTSVLDRMRTYGVPGAGVAVVRHGRVVWKHGFGIRDADQRTAVTPETVFQAASISKPVTALATLRLVERGTLDLDTDVNRYLKSWSLPASEFTSNQPVTLRRVLSHSGGLTVHGFGGYPRGALLPTVLQVLDGTGPANSQPVRSEARPGETTSYSGGGTTIEQLVLTDVTGRRFEALVNELVLHPLGMAQSSFEQPPSAATVQSAATGHRENGATVPTGWHVYPEQAAAGLWTTPSDLCRYVIGVQAALAGKPGAILSERTAREMVRPQLPDGGFGLGPVVTSKTFYHTGGNEGFRCRVEGTLDGALGAAVMTNGDGGSDLTKEILATIREVFGWSPD